MDVDSQKDNLRSLTEKFEYDAAIGGNCRVENELHTFLHCHQHMDEIKALTSAIHNPNSTKLVFQRLPKHMRRRAMSHNPNRLPRKHRLAHRAQMCKSGQPAKTKRPSRKYRRKPKNLLLDYQRRQRENYWLETHIWHAKRFHMINRWGYKLAKSSCDKTFRSSYRATIKHCLIQDISYLGCIEIQGPMDVLSNGFSRMYNKELGLSICAKAYTSGNREGSVELFSIDSYPYEALGRFQFIWKRPQENDSQHTLWIFAHPSVYDQFVEELGALFELKPRDSDIKANKKLFNPTTKVYLNELKHHFNRFRLTGPLSHAVLSSAFRPKTDLTSEENTWFIDWLKSNKANSSSHQDQVKYWSSLSQMNSATDLPPNTILALNVEDPRINRPKKRTKATQSMCNIDSDDTNLHEFSTSIPGYASTSAIWDWKLRERIANEKMSTHEICVQRNKNILVPGERCAFENKLQPIPVLLLQRPGSKSSNRLGYGSGYDVIIPAGYGLSAWMCLIMWGAKPGALRENETVAREALDDTILPDTQTAKQNADISETELRERYFRKPPNKRRNYNKLSIASPFKCPWQQLINESCTSPDEKPFYVLRNTNKLQQIERFLMGKCKYLTDVDDNALIPISLIMNGRGIANNFSIICLPKKKDFQRFNGNRKQFNNKPICTEPNGRDANETVRKALRHKHLKMLKRLRRRRVRVKRKKQENSQRKVIIVPAQTAKLITEQFEQMCELWLPKQPKTIRSQCSREVFGYVTQCQFNFHEAKVAGIGYVTVVGLKKLRKIELKNKSNQVLIRDPNNVNYRFATISIRH